MAMELKTAEEMMVPLDQYPTIRETMTLEEAMEALEDFQILNKGGSISSPRAMLVRDDKGQIVGLVRRRDILRGLEPRYLLGGKVQHSRAAFNIQVDVNLSEFSRETLAEGMRQRANRPVRDIMRPIVATINYDDHLMKAVNEVVEFNSSILCVLKAGRIIGVLRTIDVMYEVANMLGSTRQGQS